MPALRGVMETAREAWERLKDQLEAAATKHQTVCETPWAAIVFDGASDPDASDEKELR
jgi:hypothetical protein